MKPAYACLSSQRISNAESVKGKQKAEARLNAVKASVAGDVARIKMKQGGITAVFTILILYRVCSSLFAGRPVARVPFEPPAFMRKMSQRGLETDDVQACSWVGSALSTRITCWLGPVINRKGFMQSTVCNTG